MNPICIKLNLIQWNANSFTVNITAVSIKAICIIETFEEIFAYNQHKDFKFNIKQVYFFTNSYFIIYINIHAYAYIYIYIYI